MPQYLLEEAERLVNVRWYNPKTRKVRRRPTKRAKFASRHAQTSRRAMSGFCGAHAGTSSLAC